MGFNGKFARQTILNGLPLGCSLIPGARWLCRFETHERVLADRLFLQADVSAAMMKRQSSMVASVRAPWR
jgi:hypothetical protein